MQFLFRNSLYFIPLLVVFLGGLLFLNFYSKGEEVLFFSDNRNDFLNNFFYLVNFLGEAYFYVFFGLLFLIFRKYKAVIFITLTGVTTLLLSQILKLYFGFPRPSIYFSELLKMPGALKPVPGVELVSSYTSSFPSGHTMSAFALYGFLTFLIDKPALKLLFFILATLAALARVYLGQHFLMDILGGAAFGTSIAIIFYLIFLKFEKQQLIR